jgi:hypothetical protein
LGLWAVSGEKDVLVDKEAINCQLNILLELDELVGTLKDGYVCRVPLPRVP